jgi:putative DNA primase/helicase
MLQAKERQGGNGSSPARHVPNKPARARAPRRVSLENFTLRDTPDIPTETILECLHDDEYGDGALFAELFIGRCVFDHTDNTWYIWQGHYWKEDSVQLVGHLVSGVLASTYMRAAADVNLWLARLEKTAAADDDTEHSAKIKQCKDTMKALYARAHALKMSNRMKNVLGYAAKFLPITSDKWDTHKWLLGTLDGVIELRTGTMRAGKPEDYIKTVIPAKWQGLNAQCPRFERFLTEIFEDRTEQERDELIRFLHRALGYGITGVVTEHIFLMLFGDEGRNGKDTLLSALKKVLGDTVDAVPTDVLIGATKFTSPGAAKPHLVALQGKRIAWASETDQGQRFDIAQVKEITGGNNIPARQVYGKSYTFEPSHLLVLLTNNKPHAKADDKAFWERICPIIFNMRFVDNPIGKYEHKPDKTLGAELEAEASGILAWLVRGCLAWQSVGLNVPAGVLAERAKYRDEEDTLGVFLAEYCIASIQCRVKSQVLYNKYVEWAEANNIKPMSGTSFGAEIGKIYERKRDESGKFYQGIGLRDAYPQLAESQDATALKAENAPAPVAPSNTRKIVTGVI